jgi:glycogen(starch) synthase
MSRIALLPSSYPPALGGVEELTRHLALALTAAGDEVEVWTGHLDDRQAETAEIRDGLVVRRMPMPLPATNWSSLRRSATTGVDTLFSLRSAVAAFRPDVLHVQCFGPNGAYATALSHLTGIPLVITLQGETLMDDSDIFEISRVLRFALRRGIRNAKAVTGCSAFTLADANARFGLPRGSGRVVPNGVDLTEIGGGAVPERVARLGRPYVFALGRVVEKKGFDLLLTAYAALDPDQRDRADVVVAGDGPVLAQLRSQAADLGIAAHVHFVGRLDRREVAGAMAGAELLVVPSRLEPFGIVILEGWRAGTAVVATDRGGPAELIENGTDGVLVDPSDTTAFAGALGSLLEDRARRAALARQGRARVAAFGWPEVAERYREIYAEISPGRAPESATPRDGGVHHAGRGESVR